MNETDGPRPANWTKTALRDRGWSDRLIAELLGAPDKTRRNSHYRRAAPVQLWQPERVIAAETDERFQTYQASRRRRSESASLAADRQRAALLAQIADLPIAVDYVENVLAASLRDWEDRQFERGNYFADGATAPDSDRQRWAVNFIRHNLTDYDSVLVADIAGKVGAAPAAAMLKKRILEVIAATYPEFAAEASRQAAGAFTALPPTAGPAAERKSAAAPGNPQTPDRAPMSRENAADARDPPGPAAAKTYRIESSYKLSSDWLPASEFTRIYSADEISRAVATAIEGVEDPAEQEVRIVCIEDGEIVWRSTDEEYE